MAQKVLLITPPFTQVNTPYPAMAYLKGFLNRQMIEACQIDLSLEVMLELFSVSRLEQLLIGPAIDQEALSDNALRVYTLRHEYLKTIGPVIRFLQHKNPTLGHLICTRNYLPEGSRFASLVDLEWAFGTMGVEDQARHLATMYLEDIGDFIREVEDPHFGFSRYAERLSSSLSDFQPLYDALQSEESLVIETMIDILDFHLSHYHPTVICLTVPFPGNLFSALKCAEHVREEYPEINIILGGGYCNTELRTISDLRLFEYVHYVCLDDGEAPLLYLLEHLDGKRNLDSLKRVFAQIDGKVKYYNGAREKDIPQREVGTPDYTDLHLEDYLSLIEVLNPMHRLWSDGRWNKLTMAHGCYWGKCTFCDISLDYISRYEPLTASMLCDRIEEIIDQTNQNGFHFVDEAAPPALMRDLALEIISRDLTVVWWTNIRFEKRFTPDLCRLLQASGCIAISGGLEVASDRLLSLIKKGVTVKQVARVADALTGAGIMVHAYLMYGFPTQSVQETIDSLEVVRQMFQEGILQSGFWHLFAMTAHSPVGLTPEAFQVIQTGPDFAGFANNDLVHFDPVGTEHESFSGGLSKSLFNYMHGIGLEQPLGAWFEFEVPETTLPPDYIKNCLEGESNIDGKIRDESIIIWIGGEPSMILMNDQDDRPMAVEIHSKNTTDVIDLDEKDGEWFLELLELINSNEYAVTTLRVVREKYEFSTGHSFDRILQSQTWRRLRAEGLLLV